MKGHCGYGGWFLALVLALALAACGGGGGSTSSTQAQSGSTSATATAPAPTSTAKPSLAHGSSSSSTTKQAGGAAAFVKPGADNSIPEYGSEAASSEVARAQAALSAYLVARAGAKWGRACTYLSASARANLQRYAGPSKGKASCAKLLAALSGSAAARVDTLTGGLAALRVKGEKGFALYHGPHAQKYVMPMAAQGGAWKVTQLTPIPYPLGSTPPPTR